MEKIAPKWVVWISFVLFCIAGFITILSFFNGLKDLVLAIILTRIIETSGALGNLVGHILIFYLLIYIPARIMYKKYLKKK